MGYLFGEHAINHDGDYFCRLYQRQFPSYDTLYSHCQEASRHHWCQACELVFPNETELWEHLEDPRYHHLCPDCDGSVDFPDEVQLDAHGVEAHFWCKWCDLYCASTESLNTHLIIEHAACEYCLECFGDTVLCCDHMRTHVPEEYQCPGCNDKAEDFSTIIQHLERSSECGGLEQVVSLVKATPGYRDFYISSGSGFDFYCKSCLRRWSNLSELAVHLHGSNECGWLLDPKEAFSDIRQQLLGRCRQGSPMQQ